MTDEIEAEVETTLEPEAEQLPVAAEVPAPSGVIPRGASGLGSVPPSAK